MINIPVARQSDRFILKLDPPEFPRFVANEAFFLKAARRSGLQTADAEVVRDAEGVEGLLVRRFDRIADAPGGVVRLAQEDGCQVLARYPADKYRLSSEEVVAALSRTCRAQPVAALTLLKQIAFAYLSCNGDAHARRTSPSGSSGRASGGSRPPTTCPHHTHTAIPPWRSPSTGEARRISAAPTSSPLAPPWV